MDEKAEYWEKQDFESKKAYDAFCRYRDIDKSVRTLNLAYNLHLGLPGGGKRASGAWVRWSRNNQWVKRVEAYDLYLEALARKDKEAEHIKEIQAFRERQKQLAAATVKSAIALLQKGNIRLQNLNPEDINPRDLPMYFRAAADVAEAATNSEAQALAVTELLKFLEQEES